MRATECILFLAAAILTITTTPTTALQSMSGNTATVTGLYRHAVKGLSADSLDQVTIEHAYDTFPDDRRFALLYDKNMEEWQEILEQQDEEQAETPEWLHKEKFLCAFTQPKLMAKFEASYEIKMAPPNDQNVEVPRRLLTLRDRGSQNIVWGPEDLATHEGRSSLGTFFSGQSGLPSVTCITADQQRQQQKHQFGNTSSGWKQRKDTRTIHLINANTVRNVAEVLKVPLNPTRFRPNIVVDGWEPWEEFKWIGKTLQVQVKNGEESSTHRMKLKILSKTVRCDAVTVDPLDPENILDVPKLLATHFPEHGPYLGVYAVIEDPGTISVGDKVSLLLDDQ